MSGESFSHCSLLRSLLAAPFLSSNDQRRPELNEATLKAHIKFLARRHARRSRHRRARWRDCSEVHRRANRSAGAKGAGAEWQFLPTCFARRRKSGSGTTLTISGANGRESFKFADDFVAFTGAQTEIS